MRMPINLLADYGPFSDDELFAFCQLNPKLRIERDENGQIFISSPTGLERSFHVVNIGMEVYMWNRQTKLGRVSDSNGGYTLPDSSMRAPDVAWISHERLATVSREELKKFAHVCPDFVIELASESDDLTHLKRKMKKYMANGVRLGWLVDPFSQQTLIYRPELEPESKGFAELLSGGDVLPGFEIRVSELI